jgi:uncharacterized protein YpuA (DUF1002 family)
MGLTTIISLISAIYFPLREAIGYFARKKAAKENFRRGYEACANDITKSNLEAFKNAKETEQEISKLSDDQLRDYAINLGMQQKH